MTRGDYRIFVGAFPAEPLAGEIQQIRFAYDPKTAAITPPHVTLWGTAWRQGQPLAENESDTINRLSTAASSLISFQLILGGIHLLGSRIAYLGVEPSPELAHVRAQLTAALGADKHGTRFTPHLTLAMRLNKIKTAAMVADLQRSQWHTNRLAVKIDTLCLMLRGGEDPAWKLIFSAPLAQTGGTSAIL